MFKGYGKWFVVLFTLAALVGGSARYIQRMRAAAHTPAPRTLAANAALGAVVPFPCNPVTTETDPNNCGFCGSLCGTYGLNSQGTQPGVSFQQGTCALGVCAPYTVQKTMLADGGFVVHDGGIIVHDGGIADVMGDGVAQDGGFTVRDGGFAVFDAGFLLPVDCLSQQNGSVYAHLQTNPICISVLSDVNNCGGLGILCNGTCQNGSCAGIRTLPIPIVVTVSSPVLAGSNQTITARGGTAPYFFTYAPNGDNSGGALNTTTGRYHAGAPNVIDVIEVFDSLGNESVASIHIVAI